MVKIEVFINEILKLDIFEMKNKKQIGYTIAERLKGAQTDSIRLMIFQITDGLPTMVCLMLF